MKNPGHGTFRPAIEGRLLSDPRIFHKGRFATYGMSLSGKILVIRDCRGKILRSPTASSWRLPRQLADLCAHSWAEARKNAEIWPV